MNVEIPPGYGLKILAAQDWEGVDFTDPLSYGPVLMDHLLVWEAPKAGNRYILGVDVSDGIGQDRSVIDVHRVATLNEPAEQVAQFITDTRDPSELALVVDPIGRFYKDDDGTEALAAIECNNHGLTTQSELQGHLGYSNFYVWQYMDRRDVRRRFSTAFGWYTTRRTRPMLIDFFRKAIENVDPLTGQPDLLLNSPFTISELRDFQTAGQVWEAEAAAGTHDDALFAAMIAYLAGHIERYMETEPLNEQRRRLNEERLRKEFEEESTGMRRSYQSMAISADQMYGEEEQVYGNWEGGE